MIFSQLCSDVDQGQVDGWQLIDTFGRQVDCWHFHYAIFWLKFVTLDPLISCGATVLQLGECDLGSPSPGTKWDQSQNYWFFAHLSYCCSGEWCGHSASCSWCMYILELDRHKKRKSIWQWYFFYYHDQLSATCTP